MGWLGRRAVKSGVVMLALLATGCSGLVGAGAAVVFVGAGLLGFRCYDRVSVTVTDAATGMALCDAKVTFIEGTSTIEATSCYEAALSRGRYRLRVERAGLVPYEEAFEVTKGDGCGQNVQTMYVALDRVKSATAAPAVVPDVVLPPQNGTVVAPPAAAPSGAVTAAPPSSAAPSASSAPPAALAPPAPAPSAVPAPASSSFPDAR